ncbi:MAG: hypothetical protein H0X73_07695 [Chthoniobacterales bacterium]|nr:hypothetical protein [Chthoniobacterales bacterium]
MWSVTRSSDISPPFVWECSDGSTGAFHDTRAIPDDHDEKFLNESDAARTEETAKKLEGS